MKIHYTVIPLSLCVISAYAMETLIITENPKARLCYAAQENTNKMSITYLLNKDTDQENSSFDKSDLFLIETLANLENTHNRPKRKFDAVQQPLKDITNGTRKKFKLSNATYKYTCACNEPFIANIKRDLIKTYKTHRLQKCKHTINEEQFNSIEKPKVLNYLKDFDEIFEYSCTDCGQSFKNETKRDIIYRLKRHYINSCNKKLTPIQFDKLKKQEIYAHLNSKKS